MRDGIPRLFEAKKILGALGVSAALILTWVCVQGGRAGEPSHEPSASASGHQQENAEVCSVDPPITSSESLAATIEQVRRQLASQAPASAVRTRTLNNRGYNYADARPRSD